MKQAGRRLAVMECAFLVKKGSNKKCFPPVSSKVKKLSNRPSSRERWNLQGRLSFATELHPIICPQNQKKLNLTATCISAISKLTPGTLVHHTTPLLKQFNIQVTIVTSAPQTRSYSSGAIIRPLEIIKLLMTRNLYNSKNSNQTIHPTGFKAKLVYKRMKYVDQILNPLSFTSP